MRCFFLGGGSWPHVHISRMKRQKSLLSVFDLATILPFEFCFCFWSPFSLFLFHPTPHFAHNMHLDLLSVPRLFVRFDLQFMVYAEI